MTFACLTITETDVGEHLSRSSVPEQETQKNSYGLIAQFDLPGLKKKGRGNRMRSGERGEGGLVCLMELNACLEAGGGGIQVRQMRTCHGIRPGIAKHLTEPLFGVLLPPPIAKAQAALASASKEERPRLFQRR